MTVKNVMRYRSDIDGLRAVAILLVVLFHSGITLFSGGFIGVDVFFVISGFLIGGIINKEVVGGYFSYVNFYTRRIKRIAPALVFMLFLCSLFACFFLSPDELKDYSKYAIATLLSVPNIVLWQGVDYFSSSSELNPLLMTWSLGVEEQFYVFLPIIFTFCFARRLDLFKITALITLLSFLSCAIITYIKPLPSFYLLPTRAWEMGGGVLLSLKYQDIVSSNIIEKNKNKLFFTGMASILIPAILFDDSTEFPGYMAAFPVIGSALVILSEGRVSNVFLGNRPMVFIGLFSYSWYLWHWPLLSFSRIAYNEELPAYKGVFISAISLVIAYFSYRFVELPFRKKKYSSNNKVILTYIFTVFLIAFPMFILFAVDGIPNRVNNTVIAAEANRHHSISDRCLVADTDKIPSFSECIPIGNNDAVALLGDSHAAALRAGVDHYAELKHLSVYQLTKSSCPNLIDTPRFISKNPEHAILCNNFNEKVIKLIVNSNNIKVVIISAFWDAGVDRINGINGYHSLSDYNSSDNITALNISLWKTIEVLKQSGKDVILVKDVPMFKFDAVKEVVNNNMPFRHFIRDMLMANYEMSGYSKRIEQRNKNVDMTLNHMSSLGVKVIDPTDVLCGHLGCQYMVNNNVIYYDRQHLNSLGGIHALKSAY